MSALIPALIELAFKTARRNRGGRGGYGGGGYGGRGQRPQQDPQQYSWDLAEKNARKDLTIGDGEPRGDSLGAEIDELDAQIKRLQGIAEGLQR